MTLKTRDKLIEVARQLFARKGVENTTMLDIANASEKGRRTIYTYFKNKREIHQAVIEHESDQIVTRQREILGSEESAIQKLRQFMEARFNIIICPTGRRERSDGFQLLMRFDMTRADKTRRMAAKKEIEILRAILDEGMRAGEFSPAQAARAQVMIVTIMKGFDTPGYAPLLDDCHTDLDQARRDLIEFTIAGIKK
ncbi:MAG: TetR family transcriptional regulator [Muribaculaceae bacterium]|nr:TetR family transcriptional regulator [Muribaculaceae bacterium]